MGNEQEVDLPQLFSDVSRTVSGIKNILGVDPPQADMASAAGTSRPSGGLASLFGGNSDVCFKTCGMEDIQFAARSAGDMLITLRVCVLVATIVLVICAVVLSTTVVYVACKRNPPRRPLMPACISDLFVKTNSVKEDLSSS